MLDVIVVGGGPAGLSAALLLGRCRRRVVLFDEGRPRNRHSQALHGYLTRDGVSPGELNARGRAELVTYGVECRPATVTSAHRVGDVFRVTLSGGGEESARFLLIATGVVDEVPQVPGMAECYGRSLHHCPYCDGWEHRDKRIAVYGRGRGGVELALSLKTWSPTVTLCTDGRPLDARHRGRLQRNGINLRMRPLVRCAHEDGSLRQLEFATGAPLPCDAMFFTTGQRPRCRLAEQLGCRVNKKGTIDTSLLSETNVPGVFVAGDASHDAQFAIVAAAEGAKAALAINQALQQQECVP